MAAKIDIYNSALTILGALPLVTTNQNSRSAQALNAVYDMIRKAELRKKPNWNFAIKQVILNANAITPIFDRANAFPLPGDWLANANPFPESNYNDLDWIIQGKQIISAQTGPLNLRYVYDVTDTSQFDELFALALAARLAAATADAITQSNSKVASANGAYKEIIEDARKANAFDNVPMRFPVDPWITARF